MKIAIGADHKGFECKNLIVKNMTAISWLDVGCFSGDRCDYPEFAKLVAKDVLLNSAQSGKNNAQDGKICSFWSSLFSCVAGKASGSGKPIAQADLGILLCGSGVGMSIAANRFKNIRAGLCWCPEAAKMAKQDDNINILVIPTDFVTPEQCLIIINSWLKAEFKSGVYQDRLNQIDRLV